MEPRIYIIEGPSKIGKSSQSFLLSQKIQNSIILSMDSIMSAEDISIKINELENYLKKDISNKVILTGSLAYTVIKKDIEKSSFGRSYVEYDKEIRQFLEILRVFRYRAFLLIPKSVQFLSERKENFNPVEEEAVYKGLKHFENLYSNASFRWNEIHVSAHDTILDIHKKILSSI